MLHGSHVDIRIRSYFGRLSADEVAARVVSKILGHAKVSITPDIYRHVLESEKRESMVDLFLAPIPVRPAAVVMAALNRPYCTAIAHEASDQQTFETNRKERTLSLTGFYLVHPKGFEPLAF